MPQPSMVRTSSTRAIAALPWPVTKIPSTIPFISSSFSYLQPADPGLSTALPLDATNASSSQGFDAVAAHPRVSSLEDQVLFHRLRNQHPVEGVVVVAGQGAGRVSVGDRHRQRLETVELDPVQEVGGASNLPSACLMETSQTVATLTKT